jgi:hypothetical protein
MVSLCKNQPLIENKPFVATFGQIVVQQLLVMNRKMIHLTSLKKYTSERLSIGERTAQSDHFF